MSAAHGGWDESDLRAVLGANASSECDVRQRMEAFAATGPGADQEGTIGDTTESVASGVSTPPAPSPQARRVKATPKKFKKLIGAIPEKILEMQKVDCDDEDRAALDEAAEFLTDVFGFEFSVPESKVIVESRFWALAWVAAITALIFFKHKFKTFFPMPGDDQGPAGASTHPESTEVDAPGPAPGD